MRRITLKKTFALLFMLNSLLLSAQDFKVDGIYYNIISAEDNTVAVTFHKDAAHNPNKCYSGVVKIPSSVTYKKKNYKVVAIGYSAFSGNNIERVEIADGVEDIGENAFKACSSLTYIKIPKSLKNIYAGAFDGCNALDKVDIEDLASWCKINFGTSGTPMLIADNLLLKGEILTEIVIPDGVTEIKDMTFSGCNNVKSIKIPEGITKIGSAAFLGCESLTTLELPKSLETIGNGAFINCSGITNVVIPEGVKIISDGAFGNCSNLVHVEIPEGVIKIGTAAFSSCSALKNIEFPKSLTSLGNNAFENCVAIESVEIPNKVTEIPNEAFINCKALKSVTIPSSVAKIGKKAFFDCSPTLSLYIDDLSAWCRVEREFLSFPLFKQSELYLNGELLTELVIPDGVKEIRSETFEGCVHIKSVVIPESVTKIGSLAFRECTNLVNVEIPNSVLFIGDGAFSRCSSLTSITIPENVEIGRGIIVECENLKTVKQGDKILTKEEIASKMREAVYQVVEQQPEFPGGMSALMKYLRDNMNYPRVCKKNKIQGKTYVHFIVGSDGTIRDVEVQRSSGDVYLDKEAVRVVKSMPKWNPGRQDGKAVAVEFTLPIVFRLK